MNLYEGPPGVTHHVARVNGIRLHYVLAGEGPPLYLLHGYPQSWIMWRRMIPLLSPRYRLVIPDLRGYGDSDKPRGGYDKRTMAADIRELARHLGHERFGLVGHDRGGRVGHRYALDHGDTLTGLSVLDIVPTRTTFERTDVRLAAGYWHWFFFQVPELPERWIGADPEGALRFFLRLWSGDPRAIEEEAVQEYLRCFRIPGTVRATLEDYRAGATTDLEHDRDHDEKRVTVPVQAIWGGLGKMHALFDVLATWREKAERVEGRAIMDSGHFIPEETPEALAEALLDFFAPLG